MKISAWLLIGGLTVINTPPLLSQTEWEPLFFDDFEEGITEHWSLESGWSVATDGSNTVLIGENHHWARCETGRFWYDYWFRCKVKILYGHIHLNFRTGDQGRYFLGMSESHIYLTRDIDWGTYTDLGSEEVSFPLEEWLWVEVIANQKAIQFLVNDELILQVWDEKALTSGTIAFETLENSLFYIDSVMVTGPPQPDPPEGYDWSRTGGPPGGLGYDIRIHPTETDKVLVTDNPSGINMSYDGGRTWHQRNEGITVRTGSSMEDIPVFSATIDPGNPDNIWCGTQNSRGIFKSEDGGDTWIRRDSGIIEDGEISFRGFAIHPQNSDIVLAAAEITSGEQGVTFDKTPGKIYKTTDGGENWYPVWEGENLARVLLFDYLHPDTIYCSTGIFDREAYNSDAATMTPGGVGILRSYDGGETWTILKNGIDNLYLGYLEMHPENPRILFAAAGNHTFHSGSGTVFKTTDGGDTWTPVLDGGCFSALAIAASDPEIVYAFNGEYCYRSEDGGSTWSKFFKPEEGIWGPPGIKPGIPISAAVDPFNANKVFVNNYNGGNFLSTDGGKTWKNSSKGYTGADIRDIHVSPVDPAVVLASGRTGIFKTVNGGKEWFGLSYGLAETDLLSMSPADPDFDTIFGVVDGNFHIISSVDRGEHWGVVYTHDSVNIPGQGFHRFNDIEVAPSDGKIIYAGMNHTMNIGNLEPDGTWTFGMYRSQDGGESWTEVNNGLSAGSRSINTICIHPDSAQIAYIGTFSDGIYKTVDGGDSWTAMNNGLGSSDIRAIAIDPSNPRIMYAGSGNGFGIYKSENGGELWVECNYGFQLKCPSYLSSFGRGAEGMDLDRRGQSFTSADYYNVVWTKILDIAIDPVHTKNIYVADFSSGIHFSSDGGQTWTNINSGISLRTVTCLDISSDGSVLYAGVKGDGVLRMALRNFAPGIQQAIPDCTDTVVIYQGDSVMFDLLSFDLNEDTLSYLWEFDQQIRDRDSSYMFRSAGLEPGTYPLFATVSDPDTTVVVQWIVEIRQKNTTSVRTPDETDSGEMIRIYPNPFSERVEVRYRLPCQAEVTVDVFDIMGRRVSRLYRGVQAEGVHQFDWDGTGDGRTPLPDGIYMMRWIYRSPQEVLVQERKVVISR